MFHAYPLVVQLLTLLRPAISQLRSRDRDLADQTQRAAASILLNLAEGNGYRDRTRLRHFRIALGSALEVQAALEAAAALGMMGELEPELASKLQHVTRVLRALTR